MRLRLGVVRRPLVRSYSPRMLGGADAINFHTGQHNRISRGKLFSDGVTWAGPCGHSG